jgi:5-methylcytosine-specific restriction endonuclease McrA
LEFEGKSISAEDLPALIHSLRMRRKDVKSSTKSSLLKRRALTKSQREQVFAKTAGRCHICGGEIAGRWHADHVFPHSSGGAHSPDNYLPAHEICNNYRWDYTSDEFQLILRLGVWIKTQILHETTIGQLSATKFTSHERSLAKRRRPSTNNATAEA